jgi:hypothetical protein
MMGQLKVEQRVDLIEISMVDRRAVEKVVLMVTSMVERMVEMMVEMMVS